MAVVITSWDSQAPAGGDALNAGDDSIRAFKASISERMRNGGHDFPTVVVDGTGASTTTTNGQHCCSANFLGGGAESAHEFRIYDTDKTTTLVSFRGASFAATPSEVFFGANKVRTTGNVSAATGTFTGAVTTAALTASGVVAPEANNTRDLGIDTTNGWRDLFVARNAKIGGTLLVTGVATFTASPVFNGSIAVASGNTTGVTAVASGTYTVLQTDRVIVFTGDATANLPASASSAGREYWFTCSAAGVALTGTIVPNGADVIGQGGTITVKNGNAGFVASMHLVCVGTRWIVMSASLRPV